MEDIKEHLRRSPRALLLIDNFEHVLAAAPVVTELLGASRALKILVTSRAALHIYGEQEFQVPPLALPDPRSLCPVELLSEYPAVALFVQRARAVKPDFALGEDNAAPVVEICARLDGLPLAIELAAARVKVLTPAAILGRLESRLRLLTGGARDLPERQQTLRRAMDWSHELLTGEEQKLFRRLAVFVGGFTLEAAEAVANAGADLDLDVFDGVASLVDKSLLQQTGESAGEARFGMLETIREYGLERLAASGEEAATRRAHAAYFLVMAEDGAPHIGRWRRAGSMAGAILLRARQHPGGSGVAHPDRQRRLGSATGPGSLSILDGTRSSNRGTRVDRSVAQATRRQRGS